MAAVKPGCGFNRLVNRNGKPHYEAVPTVQKDLKAIILSELPQEICATSWDIPFSEVISGNASIDSFVAQLSPEELDQLTHGQGKMNSCYGVSGNAGAFGGVTESLGKRGIPPMITADGPSGIRIRRTVSLLPCGTALASSFNQEGVELLYGLVSREMDHFGIHMLLAPGMNIPSAAEILNTIPKILILQARSPPLQSVAFKALDGLRVPNILPATIRRHAVTETIPVSVSGHCGKSI